MAALCVKALGWDELALRLPSLVAAALTCAVVFVWTAATIGRRAALWSAAALLGCHFFLDAARQPRMDSMLTLFATAAAVSLERAMAWRPSARATWYFAAAAASIGLGALTKGILGIALPGLVLPLFLLVRGRGRELLRLDLLATFGAGVAVGLAWFIAGYELGGRAFLDWQVRMNLWSRFIPAGAGGAGYCAHPFWYFAPQILRGFLPWSLYLPAFAFVAWPRRGSRLPEAIVYALCWFTGLFILFSSSQGKCLVYILPAFPPLAILTGWAIAEAQSGLETRKWLAPLFSGASAAIAIGAAVMVTAALVVIGYGLPAEIPLRLHPTDRRFLEILVGLAFTRSLLLWVIGSLVGAGLVVTGLLRRAPTLQASGTMAIAAAGGWFWFAVMNPALAQRETLRTFAARVAAIVPSNTAIGHFGLGDCELNFYSPQPLQPLHQLSCVPDPPVQQYVVIRKQDFDAITPARRSCFSPVLQTTPDDSIGPRLLIEQTGH
jgi:hypothetical protein